MLGAEPIPDDPLLPGAQEREFVETIMAGLIKRHGFTPLVTRPIVEPTPEFFPDPWTGGTAGLAIAIRRLCLLAGLEDRVVAVQLVKDDDPSGALPDNRKVHLEPSAGRLDAFVLNQIVSDRLGVMAASARAVATLYQREHKIELHTLEGAPTRAGVRRAIAESDIVSVYLGLGVLTTEASLRHMSKAAGGMRSTRSTERQGALSPQGMAYALAIQARVLDLPPSDIRAIGKHLQPNKRAALKAGMQKLGDARTVRARFGVPENEETWPDPPYLEDLTGPFTDQPVAEAPEDDEQPEEDKGIRDQNIGKPVFRVERSLAPRLVKVLGMGSLMLGGVVTRMSNGGLDISMPQVMMGAAALAVVGGGIGMFIKDVRCSEPKCGMKLTTEMTTCPMCGGTISGAIRNPKERLAAEDALARKAEPDPPVEETQPTPAS